jgi:small-conductance mechanosensitive channel
LRQISNIPLLSKEEEVEATWEDMIEVEKASTYLFKENDPTNVATEESSDQLKSDLQEAISRISELEGSNEELKEARSKAENFLFEFKKHSDALGPESAETVERIA